MTADDISQACCNAIIAFLSDALPRERDRGGWNDLAMTAYQIGCKTLVRLGHAEEVPWGAIPRASPMLPATLPRWDDLCLVVLWLGSQKKMISFRLPDGEKPPVTVGQMAVTIVGAPPPPPPNIAAAHGLGPARVTPEFLPLLERLGLIESGEWAAAAEPVLWRTQPRNWSIDVATHPRFISAAERTCAMMPKGVREEIENLLEISEVDIASLIAKSTAMYEEARARYGPKARIRAPYSTERARQALAVTRTNDLDWVFFRKWRLDDLWLGEAQQEQALEIFHDRLAIAMRRAVMARLYPNLKEFTA